MSFDSGRFEVLGSDGFNVNWNDAMFVHHPERPDPPLVDAQRLDVDPNHQGCSASLNARKAQVMEQLARAGLLLKVDDSRVVSPHTRFNTVDETLDMR